MKKYFYSFVLLLCFGALSSCSEDNDNAPGNPVLTPKTSFTSALFGDSIPFAIEVSDADVPLSTLKVQLYYGEEKVSEKVIRTKTNGEYAGKIYAPYYANVPNGTATLKVILQNIHLTISEQVFDLPLSRPDYPYLTLVSEDTEYRMERVGLYQYEARYDFPEARTPGYIKAPAVGVNGNELTFGWDDNEVLLGSTANIPFSNTLSGEYTITFNTLTYAVDPFLVPLTVYKINGQSLVEADATHFKVDLDLTAGQNIVVTGIDGFDSWWIDSDFFTKADDNLTFNTTGKFRITADMELNYLRVEVLNGNNEATLQADGTGAIWLIGEGAGKPNLDNAVGWNTDKALCLVPIGNKKYQISFVAGQTIDANSINFKFFHQKGWGGEFGGGSISTTSDVISVGAGDGNLSIASDKTLTEGKTYVFTVDVSAGNSAAILTVEEK